MVLHQPSKVYRDSGTYKARQLPLTEMSIEDIMEKAGVNKKMAYTLKREAVEAAAPDVPNNQRQRMLVVIARNPKARNTHDLMVAMRQSGANGYTIDEHDTNKVLWSLSKTGHVKFRENQRGGRGGLFGIKLTDKGLETAQNIVRYANGGDPLVHAVADQILNDADRKAAAKAAEPSWKDAVKDPRAIAAMEAHTAAEEEAEMADEAAEDKPVPEETPEEPVKWEPPVEETYAPVVEPDLIKADSDDAVAEMVDPTGGYLSDPIQRPWFKGNFGGWPAIREIRDRARKTAKLTAAAKLLEEAGEDDIALDLMTRTTFTPLEEEIIALLEAFKELP